MPHHRLLLSRFANLAEVFLDVAGGTWPYLHAQDEYAAPNSYSFTMTSLQQVRTLRSLNVSGAAHKVAQDLTRLTSLQQLALMGDQVTLAAVTAMPRLQRLDVFTTDRYPDLSVLTALTALQQLSLTDCGVRSATLLTGLVALRELTHSGFELTDLAALAALTSLQNLNLADTVNLGDISELAAITGLQQLDLSRTKVASVTQLVPLAALRCLKLHQTPIAHLAPLDTLTGLEELDLSSTRVVDIDALGAMRVLRMLSLRRTGVANLAPLAACTAMQR